MTSQVNKHGTILVNVTSQSKRKGVDFCTMATTARTINGTMATILALPSSGCCPARVF